MGIKHEEIPVVAFCNLGRGDTALLERPLVKILLNAHQVRMRIVQCWFVRLI